MERSQPEGQKPWACACCAMEAAELAQTLRDAGCTEKEAAALLACGGEPRRLLELLARHRAALLEKIRGWLRSGETYTIRFGLGMLLCHYLDGDFSPEYLALAASPPSEEYYVRMMTAWYFATALAKQYDAALPYIERRRLPLWVHNKAIQKALESSRVSGEHKAYLRTLRQKD